MKKRKVEDDIAEVEAGAEKRVKVEEAEGREVREEARPREGLKCENCGIVFSKMAAYSAHTEFYCQKKIKKE